MPHVFRVPTMQEIKETAREKPARAAALALPALAVGAVALPVPMSRKKNCDFAFAGLKTAVRRA